MKNSLVRLRMTLVVLVFLTAPALARAQAWLPPDGEGWITLTYQGLFSDHHLDRNGNPSNPGNISNNTILLGLDYGLTERLTLDVKVAWTANRYDGADRLHGPLDTGIYHGALQDARMTLRYRLRTSGALAIAPFAGVILPTHAYETRGHSAPGRRLRALQLGVGLGRDLRPVLPNGYLQGQYSYAIVERVGGMWIDRSNVELEVGYVVAPRLTLTAAGSWQRTHGGLEFPLPKDHEHYSFHDRVARANHILLSSGATVPLSDAVEAYATVVWTASGQNTHAVKGFTIGMAWAIGRGLRLNHRDGRGSVEPTGGGMRKVTTIDPSRIWSPSVSR